jgi:type III secretory pathway component EscT
LCGILANAFFELINKHAPKLNKFFVTAGLLGNKFVLRFYIGLPEFFHVGQAVRPFA